MGTIWVREFTGGLDTRRMPETTKGGALLLARDGHINRGGEFEQRAAFIKSYSLLAGTVGLAATANGLYVFGSAVSPVMPSGVSYQRLIHPTDITIKLASIASFDLFASKLYVVAVFANGDKFHYYDGTHVDPGFVPGDFVRTIGTKEYALSGSVMYFSGIATPTAWDIDTTGAGDIDMAQQASGTENLKAVAEYQTSVAIFAERVTIIYYVDPDPTLNRKQQVLRNTGTVAPRSVIGFGDEDIFYLDESGVRSLRARDASNAAATNDVGVAIDTLLIDKMASMSAVDKAGILALIEPTSGRFWLVAKDEIFVFSYFPGSKVSAWSTYLPTYFDGDVQKSFNVEYATVFQKRVYMRFGDDIFIFGGPGAVPLYDATEPEMWTPYLDGDAPSRIKEYDGIDAAVQGTWQISAAMSPENLDASDKLATIDKTTYNGPRIPFEASSTHVSLRFKGIGSGAKKISTAAVHFKADDDED